MKHNLLASSVLLAIAGGLSTSANAISLYDYTEANSAYEDAYITGSFTLNDGNYSETSTVNGVEVTTYPNSQPGYNLTLGIDYEKVTGSPSRNTKIDVNGGGNYSRGRADGADSSSNYDATASITSDQYFRPGSNGAFWYGKGTLGITKGQEDPFTSLTAGVGYGRVVNVTPMARAMRIVEELRRRGALTSNPSKATYNKIAQIIARSNEYKSRYGASDYEQYWVADIEKVLQASGTTRGRGALGALGLLKAYDILKNESISTRKHGTLVRAGLGAVLSDYSGESSGDPAFEIGMEYHRPLNSQTQFSNEALITGIYGDDNDSYKLNNTMSLSHEVTDMIDWNNSWRLDYQSNDGDGINDTMTNSLSSSFDYHLNNKMDLNTTLAFSNTEDDVDNNGNDDWDTSLYMGVKYRLK